MTKKSNFASLILVLSTMASVIIFVIMAGSTYEKRLEAGREFIEDYYNYQQFLSIVMLESNHIIRKSLLQFFADYYIELTLDASKIIDRNKIRGEFIYKIPNVSEDSGKFAGIIAPMTVKESLLDGKDLRDLFLKYSHFILVLAYVPDLSFREITSGELTLYPYPPMIPLVNREIISKDLLMPVVENNKEAFGKIKYFGGFCGYDPVTLNVCIYYNYSYNSTYFSRNTTLKFDHPLYEPIHLWNEIVFNVYAKFYKKFIKNGSFYFLEGKTISLVGTTPSEIFDIVYPLIIYSDKLRKSRKSLHSDVINLSRPDNKLSLYFYCSDDPYVRNTTLEKIRESNDQFKEIIVFRIENIIDEKIREDWPILPDYIYKSDLSEEYFRKIDEVKYYIGSLTKDKEYKFLVPVNITANFSISLCKLAYVYREDIFYSKSRCMEALNTLAELKKVGPPYVKEIEKPCVEVARRGTSPAYVLGYVALHKYIGPMNYYEVILSDDKLLKQFLKDAIQKYIEDLVERILQELNLWNIIRDAISSGNVNIVELIIERIKSVIEMFTGIIRLLVSVFIYLILDLAEFFGISITDIPGLKEALLNLLIEPYKDVLSNPYLTIEVTMYKPVYSVEELKTLYNIS